MTEEMITRGELKGLEMSVPWMVTSGVRIESGHPARQLVQDGIQLYVVGADRTALRLDLDVHDAGDLHQALEAHMENVAAHDVKPITAEERDRLLRKGRGRLAPDTEWEEIRRRNLNAIQEQIDHPLGVKSGADSPALDDAEFLAAMEEVLAQWVNMTGPSRTSLYLSHHFLAVALERLASLNA